MSGRRVLAIDDDPIVLHLIREWLEAAGYHVTLLEDGTEIVAAVRAHRPDVVLLDVMMPAPDRRGGVLRTGGILALAALAMHHGPPVILMSAHVPEAEGSPLAAEGQRLGAVGYLAKPFTPAELSAVVTQALVGHARQEREGQP